MNFVQHLDVVCEVRILFCIVYCVLLYFNALVRLIPHPVCSLTKFGIYGMHEVYMLYICTCVCVRIQYMYGSMAAVGVC